jgi:hypothetical protein
VPTPLLSLAADTGAHMSSRPEKPGRTRRALEDLHWFPPQIRISLAPSSKPTAPIKPPLRPLSTFPETLATPPPGCRNQRSPRRHSQTRTPPICSTPRPRLDLCSTPFPLSYSRTAP